MTAMVRANGNGGALAVSGSVSLNGIADVVKLSEYIANARGFVPKSYIGQPNAIASAIIFGLEIGIGPMESLRSLHVVDGRVTMAADFMLTRAIRAGVVQHWLRLDATEARVRLTRPGYPPMELAFTMEEAKAAGLAGKDNWRKYPAAMLRARCISAAIRAYCPDVLGAGLYTPEEMGADTDEAGEPVIVERAPARAVDAAPRGEPSETSGEAACGGSCGEASEPASSTAAPAPKRLDECGSASEIAAWIAANAPKLKRAPDQTRERVRERAVAVANETGLAADEAGEFVAGALATLEAALAA